jgi:hypothetical protein
MRPMSWDEFRSTGMLWWVNRILHTFGIAIVCEVDESGVVRAFPAWVDCRGFDSKSEEQGYDRVDQFLRRHRC